MTDATDQTLSGSRTGAITTLRRLHGSAVSRLDAATAGWFNGLAARLVFASLLLFYYLNSGLNKLGEGVFGFLDPSFGAYAAILPPVIEQYGADPAAIPFFPWHLIVILGTWAEILLPLLIVLGLFSRIAALGMIVFVVVQSYVDTTFHGLGAQYVGAPFDRFPDAVIWDQRLLWLFLLVMIVVNGPGRLSLDYLLGRRFEKRA